MVSRTILALIKGNYEEYDMVTLPAIVGMLQDSGVSSISANPPKAPGILAVSLVSGAELMVQNQKLQGIIFVGQTKSIYTRAKNQHFRSGRTDSSTLRRTIGAILKDQLDLTAIPRPGSLLRKDYSHYRFTEEGEKRLTRWMVDNLTVSWVRVGDHLLDTRKAVIKEVKPPLCLQHYLNPLKPEIQNLIDKCVTEAHGEGSGYVPIIGHSYLQPIGDLWSHLLDGKTISPNSVQTNSATNGYSVSLILLTIAYLESAISRTKYVMFDRGIASKSVCKKSCHDFFRMCFENHELADKMEELYVVRDAITHAHVWDSSLKKGIGDMEFLKSPKLVKALSGDPKFDRCVDTTTRKTRILGLNVFPTRIWTSDAGKVFKVVYDILKVIENADRSYWYFTHWHIMLNAQPMKMSDFLRIVTNCYQE